MADKVFTYLAKQGQESQIEKLLIGLGLIVGTLAYQGVRGVGVMLKAVLPDGMSKRQVDKHLFAAGVPGAVERKNRYRLYRGESWDKWKIAERIGVGNPFIISEDGKLRKVVLRYIDYGCTCCGGYYELEDVK